MSAREMSNLCFKTGNFYSAIFDKQTQEPSKHKELFKALEKEHKFQKWQKHKTHILR